MKRKFVTGKKGFLFVFGASVACAIIITMSSWYIVRFFTINGQMIEKKSLADSAFAWSDTDQRENSQRTTQSISLQEKQCKPQQHIGFLKIHKSGSTTIASILQRYAVKNHLNIALPNKPRDSYAFNYLGNDRNFTMDSVIPLPPKERYHILCNHVIYNRTMFRKILPKDTFYFAIVREPEERFVSAAFYYGLDDVLRTMIEGINETSYIFSEWLEDPYKYMYSVSVEVMNHVAYDFGFKIKYKGDTDYIRKFIQAIDRDFDLVLLMDYFDESLMLLRRQLCWTFKDLIYLKKNKGWFKKDSYTLSELDRKRLREWQAVDVAIFEHFRARFWKQAESMGGDLFLEAAFFKEVLNRVNDYCAHGHAWWPSITVESSAWSEEFTVNRSDCILMGMSELHMVRKLQEEAWKKYNDSQN